MYYLNIFICILSIILISCSPTVQNSGMSKVKFEKIVIEIGKTSKSDLINKYGPPAFEGIFNKDLIYYVSHKSSYKLLDEIKTTNLSIYEINLNDKNIVESFQKYSEKDTFDISVSNKASDHNKDFVFIWKEMLNNMRRRNIQD